jgi:hypothetical protein
MPKLSSFHSKNRSDSGVLRSDTVHINISEEYATSFLSVNTEDGGGSLVGIVDIQVPDHTMSNPTRPRSNYL